MAPATSAWVFIGLFILLPLVLAAVLLLAVESAVTLVLGLIVLFTFACTGFVVGAGMMVAD